MTQTNETSEIKKLKEILGLCPGSLTVILCGLLYVNYLLQEIPTIKYVVYTRFTADMNVVFQSFNGWS